MNKYVIVSGGTGSMCVRALIFLLTAMKAGEGMGFSKLYIRIVDMDKQSDAAKECKMLIKDYNSLRRQTNDGADGGLKLPEIVLDIWDFTDAVKSCAQNMGIEIKDGKISSFKALFMRNEILSPHDALLMNTFFGEGEQKTDLDKGFYGHPNIGAVVFHYVREHFLDRENSDFMKNLYEDMEQCGDNAEEKVSVFLYGSLFGGTGASVSPNLIDVLRSISNPKKAENWGKKRLRIGVTMMMPYFRLPEQEGGKDLNKLRPDTAKFFGQTKEALQYYKEFGIAGKVDSFLVLGQKDLCRTNEVYARGENQYQHFHVLLLAAAAAGLRFLEGELEAGVLLWRIPWEAKTEPAWKTLFANDMGLSKEEARMQEFFRFSVIVSQYMSRRYGNPVRGKDVYDHLNTDPTVYKTCEKTCQKIPQAHGFPIKKWNAGLSHEELDEYYINPIKNAVGFCAKFIRFYFECAISGYDWTRYHVIQNQDGKVRVTSEKADEYMADMTNRMVDLLNLEETDRMVDSELPAEIVRELTLNRYFNFETVNRGRMTDPFVENTVGKLFEDQSEKVLKEFRGKGTGVKFSQIYIACYEAAKLKKA